MLQQRKVGRGDFVLADIVRSLQPPAGGFPRESARQEVGPRTRQGGIARQLLGTATLIEHGSEKNLAVIEQVGGAERDAAKDHSPSAGQLDDQFLRKRLRRGRSCTLNLSDIAHPETTAYPLRLDEAGIIDPAPVAGLYC